MVKQVFTEFDKYQYMEDIKSSVYQHHVLVKVGKPLKSNNVQEILRNHKIQPVIERKGRYQEMQSLT